MIFTSKPIKSNQTRLKILKSKLMSLNNNIKKANY